MRKKPHPEHIKIAKKLDTTPGALASLLSIKGHHGSLNRGAWLTRKGLIDYDIGNGWKLTPAGADLLTRARALGY